MYRSILQTKQWAQLKEKYGQKAHWISDVLFLEHKLPLGRNFLYAPEIDQVQLHDMDKMRLDEMVDKIRPAFVRIEIVNSVNERQSYLDVSLSGFKKSFEDVQPEHRQIVDIRPSEEQILAQMKSKGRYNIKVAQRHGVQVEMFGVADEHRATHLGHEMEFWGEAKGGHPELPPARRAGVSGSKYVSENVEIPKRVRNDATNTSGNNNNSGDAVKPPLNLSLGKGENEGVDAVQTFYNLYGETVRREKIKGRSQEYFQDLFDILGAQNYAKIFIARANDKPLATAIVTFYQGIASYLYGGSSREMREAMAPFALHWEIIKKSKELGCSLYDLLGISPSGASRHKWEGLTRFKENFGGKKIQIIGSYDKILDKNFYRLYKFMARIRKR